MDGRKEGKKERRMDGQKKEGCINGWMNRRKDGWMDGGKDGCMHECTGLNGIDK